ncbi:MAG: PAS domain-containing protein [Erysipelotrichaceae bacterium]
MAKYIQLTETDKKIISSYANFIDSLGGYLGEGYEIILHTLDNLDHSVVNIYNGHYSGRQVGAPITDFALYMLSKIEETKNHKPIYYVNTNKNGVKLRSCTIPINNENRTIGLICINFYTNTPVSALLKGFDDLQGPTSNIIIENYTSNAKDLLDEKVNTVKMEVLNDKNVSPSNVNKEICARLFDQGIFNLKDSVINVANILEISKNTVYMHIRNNKEK